MNTTKLPVIVRTGSIKKPRLDVNYPIVDGMENKAVQKRINKIIQRTVDKLVRDQGFFENPQTDITASYEIKNNQRGILSLSIINYAFAGGAHGMTIIKSLTIDVETGKVYELKDLFKPNSNYVKRLSDIIKRQIKERDIMTLEEFKQIRPDQDFYIADKSLVIYFQLYELTAYAYGFPYFPISVYEIEDILKEGGPMQVMMG